MGRQWKPRLNRAAGAFAILVLCGMGALAMGQAVEQQTLNLMCTLSSKELQARREGIIKELRASVQESRELEAGWSFRYSETQLDTLVEFIRLERKCCTFLEFALRFEAGNGPVWLSVTGPPEAKVIISAELVAATDGAKSGPK
jgi:hypothetical protein